MLGTRTDSLPDCRPLLAGPDDLTLVFQPIVDLVGARVAGYAALPRFPGTAGAHVWLAAAREAGLASEVQALTVHKALAAVPALPPGCFLTVDVDPVLLGAPQVRRAWAGLPGLAGLAIRLLGDVQPGDTALLARLEELRDRGALVLTDGARPGPAGPDLVSLRLTEDISGREPLPAVLAELAVREAGRLGARVLADGLATPADLAAAVRLDVGLGRGWLLAPPSPQFTSLSAEVRTLVSSHAARARRDRTVARLVRPVRQVAVGEPVGAPPAVLVDRSGDPLALLLADASGVRTAALWPAVHPSAGIGETLQLALTRPSGQRFDPVVCTDPAGQVIGLLRVQDLVGG